MRGLARRAHEFSLRLASIKKDLASPYWDWYPYESLAAFTHLEKLFGGSNRELLRLIGEDPVADIGCGDGDISFFLESLGCRVHAFDHPVTNHSGMEGVRALKERLQSDIELHAIDIDGRFELPARYGVALFLGTLYHLKNPFYALETISRRARYCVLSTLIAGRFPTQRAEVAQDPVAYLLDSDELNDDNSNYWVFSEAGLRRLLKRTNWRILEFAVIEGGEAPGCARFGRDLRAFCLAQSCYALSHLRLTRGWHEPEETGWRWTAKSFAVEADWSEGVPPSRLRVDFFIPNVALERSRAVTLSAAVNDAPLRPERFSKAGYAIYERPLPRSASAGPLRIEFQLDSALPPDARDSRERGLIVNSLEIL